MVTLGRVLHPKSVAWATGYGRRQPADQPAIHTLDLMQWFAGGVTRVKGVVDSGELADVTEGEDSAMATLHFANGARGLFYASNCNTTDSRF